MKSVILMVVISLMMGMVATEMTHSLMQRNYRTMDCFKIYFPKIEAIAKKYEQEHNACKEATVSGRSMADAAVLEKRTQLASCAEDACKITKKCNEQATPVEALECFAERGNDNARVMYVINAHATDYLADLLEEYRLLTTKEYKCTNATKRTYESESAHAYDDLTMCIAGMSVGPVDPDTEVVTTPPKDSTKPTGKPAPKPKPKPNRKGFREFRDRVREFFNNIGF